MNLYITKNDIEFAFKKHRIYWIRNKNLIIFSTPKSGNTAFMDSIFNPMGIYDRFPTNDNILYVTPRIAYYIKKQYPKVKAVALVRDPIKRLTSCYNDGILRGERTALIDWGFPFYSEMSQFEFVKLLETFPQHELDMHGRSLAYETQFNGENIIDEWILTDDMKEVEGQKRVKNQMKKYGVDMAQIKIMNVKQNKSRTIEQLDALPCNEWYMRDVEIYNKVKGN